MNNSSKILAFAIPTLQAGGMERVMSEIIKYISLHAHTECHLIVYGKLRELFYNIPDTIYLHQPSFSFNDEKRTWMTLKTMNFIRSTIHKINPDAVLSFGEKWNNLILLSLFGVNVPIYVSDRSAPNKNHGIFHNTLRRLLYPKAAGIIVQTEKAKEIFKDCFNNNNVKVIPNQKREIKLRENTKRESIVVSVGRLIDTKHYDRLIDIFTAINNKNWKLVIIGGDANKQTNSIVLQNKIEKLGMETRITLAGTKKNIDEYLFRASIFAFTSSSEGFPNVIGEAMSAGLPVVAYDCIAGPSELIEDKNNGFLIPLFDDAAFKNKLEYLMNNKSDRERMGKHARESVKHLSVDKIGKKYYDFLSYTLS